MTKFEMKAVLAVSALAAAVTPVFAQGEAEEIFSEAESQLKNLVDPICSVLQVVLAVVALFYSVLNAKKAMGGDHDAQNAIAKVLAYSAAGFILLAIFKGIAR